MSDEAWNAEVNRVAALRALRLLDTPTEERFDRITRLAHQILDVPIALVSLVDLERQWFKSCLGLDHRETPRSVSFCSHAIKRDALMEVPDTRTDPRFAGNPIVTGPQRVRFYAGQPILAPSGHRIGTLCVLDRRPRTLTGTERGQLADLAAWVELECGVVQANLASRDAEKARQDFVAVVSHELRTPLTSMHASLELLASGRFGGLAPQAEQLVRIAERSTGRLVRLANDVLDLSRVQSGQLRLHLEEVSVPEVVRNAVHAVAGTAERAEVALVECGVDGELPQVRGDADRLVQVLTNLLANAIAVSPPGAPVEAACAPAGLTVRIDVRDRGPGVPQSQLDRIFEPFVQVDPGPGNRGAGLGLAITRGIVEAHGGLVRATSTPGAGSTFSVTLPVAGPQTDLPWW